MKKYKIIANKNLKVGKIEKELYSSFIEHLGRCIYGGIYEPTHPTSDEDGFRKDVLDVVKDLDLELIRYPGGNFVSGYFWEDGIGPRENRPVRREEAWHSIETNAIGTDEFMKWVKKANCTPMMALNLGTGTIENAVNLVEYCNSNGNGKYANLRRQYGDKDPYNIKYWCLGNEMDGDWQIGHMPVEDYITKAHEISKLIRQIDPNLKLIACGSSTIDMPTFPSWDRKVLEGLYDDVDYLSVHQYFFESTTENDFYASYLAMEKYITSLRSVLNYVKAHKKSKKDIYLCFDEYNVWYNVNPLRDDWQIAPPINEEFQSLKDTIVFGGLINSLLNNCDIIKIACLAQLVNVIAPIMTENNGRLLLNTIYYPFLNATKYNRGETLKTFVVDGDQFDSRYGKAYYISQAITVNDEELVINISNYAKEESNVEILLTDFNKMKLINHSAMFGDDMDARNTFDNPYNVVPIDMKNTVKVEKEKVTIQLKPQSWNCIRLKIN
ncbi:MAG TPA: alpha-N-arabinofuranosidase [Erysipelotrichaceae bacterium]|nr:alpha-N-arabinofuranosidase [Erysipelotrichaceae bacterium]